MSQTATAIGILGISKTGNNYAVTALPQPEAAYIPEYGTGGIYTVDITATPTTSDTSGVGPNTPKIACKVFITHNQVTATGGKKYYNVGLLILAADNKVNIGPFFGNLDFATAKTMNVKITTPLLNGSVAIALKAATGNKCTITADLKGALSGSTAVQNKDVNP